MLKKRFTRLKMAQTDFDIFQASCLWSNKWSQQIFMYWSIGCQNVLTNQSPLDRPVVALDVDGFSISRDALVCIPLFEESEIVFCTVISQCSFNRRNLCLRFEKTKWIKRFFTTSWSRQNKRSKCGIYSKGAECYITVTECEHDSSGYSRCAP